MSTSGCPHPLIISVSPQNKHNRAHLKDWLSLFLNASPLKTQKKKKTLKSSETPLWETPMTFPFCSVSKVHLLQSKEWPDFSHDRLTEQDYRTRTLGDENLDDVWHPLAQGTESTWINNEMRDFTFYCCSYHLGMRILLRVGTNWYTCQSSKPCICIFIIGKSCIYIKNFSFFFFTETRGSVEPKSPCHIITQYLQA